jgi:hypothetical protein
MPVMMKASAGDEEMGTPSIDTKAEDMTVSATVTFAVE